MSLQKTRIAALTFGALGVALTLLFHWLVFFWVPDVLGFRIAQRIYYIHVPAAWVAFLAFGMVAVCSVVYLWLREEKADQLAHAAAEGGLVFTTIVLTTGPLWARLQWGVWWTPDPRLTLTALLWFVYLGYHLARGATENPELGKKFAAVVGIVGAALIPLIHVSVLWWGGTHPEPVVLNAAGSFADPEIETVLFTAFAAWIFLFLSLVLLRYTAAQLEERVARASPSVLVSEGESRA
ncbi:MAG: cytochrome c biogenesis protein [Gemmatimonadota bacterium]